MNLLSIFKTLNLIIAASSTKTVRAKNMFGDHADIPVQRAAINELKRPPLILSAPTEKRNWTSIEIEEFINKNPIFKL